MTAFPCYSECSGVVFESDLPYHYIRTFISFKEGYKIHLYNYVRSQYIQGGIHIHVIQWYLCNQHSHDKSDFLYIRQYLRNQRRKENEPLPCFRLHSVNCYHHISQLINLSWAAASADTNIKSELTTISKQPDKETDQIVITFNSNQVSNGF